MHSPSLSPQYVGYRQSQPAVVVVVDVVVDVVPVPVVVDVEVEEVVVHSQPVVVVVLVVLDVGPAAVVVVVLVVVDVVDVVEVPQVLEYCDHADVPAFQNHLQRPLQLDESLVVVVVDVVEVTISKAWTMYQRPWCSSTKTMVPIGR